MEERDSLDLKGTLYLIRNFRLKP